MTRETGQPRNAPLDDSERTRRQELFQPGLRYRVRKNTQSWKWSFEEGETVGFKCATYSVYDDTTFYEFIAASDQTRKSWLLHDQQPIGLAQEVFEALPAPTSSSGCNLE
jgi:hypothetical protein